MTLKKLLKKILPNVTIQISCKHDRVIGCKSSILSNMSKNVLSAKVNGVYTNEFSDIVINIDLEKFDKIGR